MGPSGFTQIISVLQLTWDVEGFYTERHSLLWEAPPIPLGFYTQLLESHTTSLDGDRAPRGQKLGTSVASKEGDSVAGPEG